jgi:hypothetical protein
MTIAKQSDSVTLSNADLPLFRQIAAGAKSQLLAAASMNQARAE